MRTHDDPWLSVDREHELQGEADDAFDAALAAETKRQAAAMRTNALTGHEQTLSSLTESFCHELTGKGITEALIVATLTDPLMTLLLAHLLLKSCIDEDAETAALVEMERGERERAGGLNMAAMRAMAPQEVRVPA